MECLPRAVFSGHRPEQRNQNLSCKAFSLPRGKVEHTASPLPLPGVQENPSVTAEALIVADPQMASPEADNRPGNGVTMLLIGAFLVSMTY